MRANTERRLRREVARRAGCQEGGCTNALCAYCGNLLWIDWRGPEPLFYETKVMPRTIEAVGTAHLDHIVPECRNGATSLDNTVIACAACNMAKGDSALGDPGFIRWLQRRRNSARSIEEVLR